MAITVTVPNHYKYLLKTKQIDESGDTYKIILMNAGFVFDKDAHGELGDVAGNQLATGNGYSQNSKVLSGVTITENDTTDKAETRWASVSWTASGGSIGPTGAAIIYNDTVSGDPIACCIEFGVDKTIEDGFGLLIETPGLDLC